MFWKRIFILLCALYTLLKLLGMADSNQHNMDKVCFYLHLTREHVVKSVDDLCHEDMFPSSYKITQEVEADVKYEEDEDGDTSDVESNGNEDVPDFTMEMYTQ